MASTARLGLKHVTSTEVTVKRQRRNGLYSPFGIETSLLPLVWRCPGSVGMASTARLGLKRQNGHGQDEVNQGRNGLYSPFGIETRYLMLPQGVR